MHTRFASLLAAVPLAAVLLVACQTGARKADPPASAEDGGATSATRSPIPDDPRIARFQRVDLLISQWDAGQAEGRGEQADQVFQQVRAEVDGSFDEFASAAKGTDGVRLQYLGVAALGFSSNPGATPVLVERLTDSDAHLVGNALIAIKLRADPRTPLAPILRLLASGATEPKRYAPLALANVLEARQLAGMPRDASEERSALHLLSGVVADRDPYVRLHVAKALAWIQEPGAFDLLIVLLKDEHIRIRVAAAVSLERLGDPRGFGEVVSLLNDAPDESKPIVRDLLVSYAERMQHRPLDPAEVERLGTGALAWNRWFSDFQAQRGVALSPGKPPSPGPAPVRVTFPPPSPAPAHPPAVMPPTVMPPPVMPPPAPAPSGAPSGVPAPPPPPRIR